MYEISLDKLKYLQKYLNKYLDKEFIQASKSSIAAPIFFVKKSGKGLRFYVDYRALNAITIKN